MICGTFTIPLTSGSGDSFFGVGTSAISDVVFLCYLQHFIYRALFLLDFNVDLFHFCSVYTPFSKPSWWYDETVIALPSANPKYFSHVQGFEPFPQNTSVFFFISLYSFNIGYRPLLVFSMILYFWLFPSFSGYNIFIVHQSHLMSAYAFFVSRGMQNV